jgi:hypothetical protein
VWIDPKQNEVQFSYKSLRAAEPELFLAPDTSCGSANSMVIAMGTHFLLNPHAILQRLPFVLLIVCVFKIRRLTIRVSRAEARAATLAREAGALADHLLQTLQGFALTLHVAAQHLSYSPAVKRAIEQASHAADQALLESSRTFERLHLLAPGRRLEKPDEERKK